MTRRPKVGDVPPYESADPTIRAFADYLDLRGMTATTRVAYQRDLDHFGSFLKARATGANPDERQAPPFSELAGASYDDIVAYQTYLVRSRAYSARSLRRKASTLRTFYKSLRQRGLRDDNPSTEMILPKIGKPLPKALKRVEIDRVFGTNIAGLNPMQRARDRAILECLYACGIRRQELVNLDLADVDLDDRTLRVVKGKGQKDRRVPMTPAAADAMRAYLGVRPKALVPAFFVGRGGRRISPATVYAIVRAYLRIAGIEEHASPHTFRHSIATHLRENGADLLFLKEFLGHESTATTEVYTKLASERLREEFNRFHPRLEGDDAAT